MGLAFPKKGLEPFWCWEDYGTAAECLYTLLLLTFFIPKSVFLNQI